MLQRPADEDLRGVLVVLPGSKQASVRCSCAGCWRWWRYLQGDVEDRVVPAPPDEGRVRLHDDAVRRAVRGDLPLLAVRVQLAEPGCERAAGCALGLRTSSWFTLGVSRPAARISSRCLTPLCNATDTHADRGAQVSDRRGRATRGTCTHKLETPIVRILPWLRASTNARHASSRRSLPASGVCRSIRSRYSTCIACIGQQRRWASGRWTRTELEPPERAVHSCERALVPVLGAVDLRGYSVRRCVGHARHTGRQAERRHALTKISALGSPLALTARPTSASFLYSRAESTSLAAVSQPATHVGCAHAPVAVSERRETRDLAVRDVRADAQSEQGQAIAWGRVSWSMSTRRRTYQTEAGRSM